MDIIKDVIDYMNSGRPMDHYSDDYNLIEFIAFLFLIVIYALIMTIYFIVVFITVPIWIIPYLVYRTITKRMKNRNTVVYSELKDLS